MEQKNQEPTSEATVQSFKLLIVDDDSLIHQTLKSILPKEWKGISVINPADVNYHHAYHAAFVDLHLKPGSKEPIGLNVIKKLTDANPHLPVFAISGDLDRELMEQVLKNGAHRFLAKPLLKNEVLDHLAKIEALIQIKIASQPGKSLGYIGSSKAAEKVRSQIAQLKSEKGPILIEGESGTGKEVVAQILFHQEKSNGPFISVNMAGIPETLFESELFGHIKGAFTGADQNKIGLIEAAAGGDLFLDEIEALPLAQQAKLLRFLESGEIKKVGAKETQLIQCRVIVATNRKLEDMVKSAEFREDLLFRISGKKITLPPLREHKDDIKELAEHFLKSEMHRRNKSMATDGLIALSAYHWPGNVRELKRVCEQLSLTSLLPVIRKEDVLQIINPQANASSTLTPTGEIDVTLGFSELVARYEKEILVQALKKYNDVDQTAEVLDLSRSSIYKKIKDYKIEI